MKVDLIFIKICSTIFLSRSALVEAESVWLQGKRREKKQVSVMPRKGGRPRKVVVSTREGQGSSAMEGEGSGATEGEGCGATEQDDHSTDGEASAASAEEEVDKSKKATEAAEAMAEARKYGIPGFIPIDLLAQAMPVLLREKMSVRQIVMAVATFIRLTRAARNLTPCEQGSRLSLDDFIISRSTSGFQKKRRSEEIAADTIEEYTRVVKEGNHPVVVHWDEKMMRQEMDGRADFKARLITCLSSPASPDSDRPEHSECQLWAGKRRHVQPAAPAQQADHRGALQPPPGRATGQGSPGKNPHNSSPHISSIIGLYNIFL